MKTILTILREVWSLFVEDASLTIGVLVCIVLAHYLFPAVALPAVWRGPLLFLLLAGILLENVYRSASKCE